MKAESDSLSFYLFDFDDNIMILDTHIFVRNMVTKQERAVTTSEFAALQPLLGRPGYWEDFAVCNESFRDFRDVPPEALEPDQVQRFVTDIAEAIASHENAWKGPSWKFLVHACERQRPVSLITARGHSRETLRAGVAALVKRKLLPREPRYHSIYPVGNDAVRHELGDKARELTTPALKRLAIIRTVNAAFDQHGSGAPLRFGMSDDDPRNIDLIIRAMCECKKRHRSGHFFVINTHMNEEVKLEVLPVDYTAERA